MKFITFVKGENGRWRISLNFVILYLTLSSTPVKFKSRQTVYYTDSRRRFKSTLIRYRGQTCQQCGNYDPNLELHHIISPLERPDLTEDPQNVQLLCHDCHYAIHHPEIIETPN